MLKSIQTQPMKWLAVVWVALLAGVLATVSFAQDGEFVLADNDPKLNVDVTMGGANIYCVDANRTASVTIENGGGFQVLDPQGEELLFVGEDAVNAGVAAMQATGQYQLLGMGTRAWYGGAPLAIYILPNGEFQLNAADEWGKPVEFQWRECRNATLSTGDGCNPGWDRNSNGTCVFVNLY
jgi:hypothetical protein